MTLTCLHQYFDPYAPEEGQTDVLLRTISKFRHFESVLPGCQIQQEQHCATREMVQQLPVCNSNHDFLIKLNFIS